MEPSSPVAAPEPAPRVRFCGHVERGTPGQIVLGEAFLEPDGGGAFTVKVDDPFDLVLEGGERVRIELAPEEELRLLLPEVKARGPWGELEGTPLASAFRTQAPGPHVRVKLHGAFVVEGEPIELLVEVSDTEIVEGAVGWRDTPARRISAARAVVIAAGPRAKEQMDAICRAELPALQREARPARPRGSWKRWAGGAVALAVVALLAKSMVASPVVLVDLVAMILFSTAVANELSNVGTATPHFRTGSQLRHDPELVWPFVLCVGALFGALCATVLHVYEAFAEPALSWVYAVPTLCAAAAIVNAIASFAATRYAVRMARILLEAPAHPERLEGGAWGTSTGVIRDPTPVTSTMLPAAFSLSVANGKTELLNDGTFFVETSAGSVEVDPRDAVWASTVKKTKIAEDNSILIEEIVPVGGKIAVAGRLRRDKEGPGPALSSTGPESLVLFATAEGTDPLDALRGFLRSRDRAIALLVGAALAIAALTDAILGLPV